jgi:hypothetical protein
MPASTSKPLRRHGVRSVPWRESPSSWTRRSSTLRRADQASAPGCCASASRCELSSVCRRFMSTSLAPNIRPFRRPGFHDTQYAAPVSDGPGTSELGRSGDRRIPGRVVVPIHDENVFQVALGGTECWDVIAKRTGVQTFYRARRGSSTCGAFGSAFQEPFESTEILLVRLSHPSCHTAKRRTSG